MSLKLQIQQASRPPINKSLRQIAKDCGISASFLSDLANGKKMPSLARAKQLAECFGVSIEELFFEVDKNENNV